MAEVKWIKITTNMFEDEKIKLIDAMPERDTIHYIWIRLLVQAGKTNASGFIFLTENIPYSEEMLSTIFNRPINSIRLALNTLAGFGMIKIESSFLEVTNWNKHQNVEGLDKIKQQNRQRQSKFRNKKKIAELNEGNVTSNVTVTQSNAIEQEQDIEQDIEQELDTTTVVVPDEIKVLKKLLKDLNLTDEQVSDIYINANGDLQHIVDVYNFSKTQNVKNIVAWLKKMVKPGEFQKPKGVQHKDNFNNYPQREYNFAELEKQLLGWE
ncbi:MAG: phage replisome organizer N-terminal domain-containing protein [Bacillota bacterium]|nr:phage replisome organizer N-terminal domain-containing protein [Bacillota bacterium]